MSGEVARMWRVSEQMLAGSSGGGVSGSGAGGGGGGRGGRGRGNGRFGGCGGGGSGRGVAKRGRGRGRGGGRGRGQAGGNTRGGGGSGPTGNHRDGSNAVPASDQVEGQAGEVPRPRMRWPHGGVYRIPGHPGSGRDGTLTRKEVSAARLLGLPLDEYVPPQEEEEQQPQQQQQQQQAEVAALQETLQQMRQQMQQMQEQHQHQHQQQQHQHQQEIAGVRARERHTREVDEDLSNRMEEMGGLYKGPSEDEEEDEEEWREGEVVVFEKTKAKKGAEEPQK
ncbi:hypothetical protein ACHAPE_002747 [Trichoderma viride]